MKCNCYVNKLSDYLQFVTRWGAHSLKCPKYRESHDIVDKAKDQEFRLAYE